MRQISTLATVVFVAATVASASGSPALAGPAFGVYVAPQGGSADWDWELDGGFQFEPQGNTRALGAGFVLDTQPGEEGIFNYRLEVGLERMDADLEDGFDETLEMLGVSATHTFGFRLYGSSVVRLWLGPSIKLGFYGVKFQSADNIDAGLLQFGVGGMFGANFRVADRFRIGVEGGLYAVGYAGGTEDEFGVFDGDLTATENRFHLGVAFLF